MKLLPDTLAIRVPDKVLKVAILVSPFRFWIVRPHAHRVR